MQAGIQLPRTLKERREQYLKIGKGEEKVFSSSRITSYANYMSVFGNLPKPQNSPDKEEAAHLTLGRLIHLAVETEGDSLSDLVKDESDLLKELKPKQLQVARMGLDIFAYCNVYNNETTRKALESDDTAILEVEEKLEEIRKLYEPYREFVKASKNKTIVNEKDYETIHSAYRSVLKNEEATRLLLDSFTNPFNSSDIVTFNELPIFYRHSITVETMPGFDMEESIPMKSLLDRIVIDKKEKVIKLIDIKTSSDSPNSFYRSYKKYSYWRQLGVYSEALKLMLLGQDYQDVTTELDVNLSLPLTDINDYHWKYYIVYIGTQYPVTRVFKISPVDVAAGIGGGTLKPMGAASMYNEYGELQVFLSNSQKDTLQKLGLVNIINPDLYAMGYYAVLRSYVNAKYDIQ